MLTLSKCRFGDKCLSKSHTLRFLSAVGEGEELRKKGDGFHCVVKKETDIEFG
jgi:hypothetical protein